VIAPALDWGRLRSARRRRGPARLAAALPLLAVPVLGTALFLALFSAANPLIADAFARLDLMLVVGGFSVVRLAFWARRPYSSGACFAPRAPSPWRPRRRPTATSPSPA
jgi:hypothetical protein